MIPTFNRTVLMSGAEFFDDSDAINAYMDNHVPVNRKQAVMEHTNIRSAVERAGIKVITVDAPPSCQDGIFTANWGLNRGDTVVLSTLPEKRKAEESYAEKVLKNLGKRTVRAPYRFSGQGDALPCGNLLFVGSVYRTDPQMHQFLADELGYEVIGLQAVPELDADGRPVTNPVTGWPDSFFYDLDLGIAILRPDLIAWYPGAWTPQSQEKVLATSVKKIEVTKEEAMNFGCNLISTGSTVVMGRYTPKLQAAVEAHGLTTITVDVKELGKGGGYIRCTTLTLDNK